MRLSQEQLNLTSVLDNKCFKALENEIKDSIKRFNLDVKLMPSSGPALATKAPDAAAFLKKISWSGEEVGSVMLAIREGAEPAEAAKDWIKANPERVAEWLK